MGPGGKKNVIRIKRSKTKNKLFVCIFAHEILQNYPTNCFLIYKIDLCVKKGLFKFSLQTNQYPACLSSTKSKPSQTTIKSEADVRDFHDNL